MLLDRFTKGLLAVLTAGLWANAIALWASPPAATAAASNIIRAEQFIVVDNNGKERAVLGLDAVFGKTPELRLLNEDGTNGVNLRVLSGGRSLLWLGGGNGSLWLGTTAQATESGRSVDFSASAPHVSLFDKDNRVRAVLGAVGLVSKTGELSKRPPSSLVLFSPDAAVLWKVP